MSILSTGVSGLLAFQRALATTSHNIANAATEGYSRQQVEMNTRNPQRLGNQYVGQGVQISGIRRLQDEIVAEQLRTNLSRSTNSDVRAAFAERIDSLLSDESTGVTPALENYFAAVQDVANDPTSIPARTVLLNEAETLTQRFGVVNDQLEEQRSTINTQIGTAVEEINQYAQSLSDLNRRIVSGFTAGSPPNDLLDQRDVILNKLAEKIDVSLTTQENGAVNVFVGTGQALVMGVNANELVAENLSGDPMNLDIGIRMKSGDQPINITRFVSGGEIGGLLETRTNLIDTAQNELGLIGLTLATSFNQQNGLGLDLNGNLGGDLFTLPAVKSFFGKDNAERDLPTVTIDDVSQLTASDYRLSYDSGAFTLTRQPANTPVTLTGSIPILSGDGLRIDTTALAGAFNGDDWLIQPTRFAASGIEVKITEPEGFAAASGVLTDADNRGGARPLDLRSTATPPSTGFYLPATIVVKPVTSYNLISPVPGASVGGASIKSFQVLDPTDADLLATPMPITFDTTTNPSQFNVNGERFTLDPSGTTTITANGWELKVQGTPTAGTAFQIGVTTTPVAAAPATTTITGTDWALDLRGTPAAEDMFTIDLSTGREGDNRNLLAMAAFQDADLVHRGSNSFDSFQGSYDSILSEVGTQTRQAQISRDSSAVLLADAQAQRESISGVNLDEEAANLLRYQQAYQAAAQVIAVSNSLFDTLLNAIGR
jgi:flagellar hook-associated protein 1 FlgK